MLILRPRSTWLWVRHMRCLGSTGEDRSGIDTSLNVLFSTHQLSQFAQSCVDKISAKDAERDITPKQLIPAKLSDLQPVKQQSSSVFPFGSFYNNSNGQDLRRFLEEVGTDPKEARFWLKHFKRSSEPFHPFAVVQVDESVFRDQEMKKLDLSEFLKSRHLKQEALEEQFFELNKLASALAFLHRNNMKCVVIHGEAVGDGGEITSEKLQRLRGETSYQSMLLASMLELHGAPARPLFAGSNIIQASPTERLSLVGNITGVNLDPVYWAMQSDHIPIIQAIGESFSGQMLGLDVKSATAQIACSLQPLKVLFINMTGGIQDEKGEVIANINLPDDIDQSDKSWVTPTVRDQLDYVADLLYSLPRQSSVVFSSANKLLAELFSHHGTGTFFKITEPILKYTSLKGIDKQRLMVLINKSFGKDLYKNYLEDIEGRLHTLYLSEEYVCSAVYNSAAIITVEEGCPLPYLDKFAVGLLKQGEGVGDVLWECIRKDFKRLFWRSRDTNRVNPWYFKRCEGSWTDGQWTVFWYGGVTHKESSSLLKHALALPSSFPHEEDDLEKSTG